MRCRLEIIWCLMVLLLATNGTHLRETPRKQHWRRSTALNGFLLIFSLWIVGILPLDLGQSELGPSREEREPQGRGRQRENLKWLWSLGVLWRIRTRLLPLIALTVHRLSCSGFVTAKHFLLWGKPDEQFSLTVSVGSFITVAIWACNVQKLI